MTKKNLLMYEKKLQHVQQYIFNEIKKGDVCRWDTLANLNHLADIACLSPHHWHRIYHAMTGETIAKTIRRMRLYHASVALLYGNKSLERIAHDFGYASLASFSRAFNQLYQMPPNKYRQQGSKQVFDFVTLNQSVHNNIHAVIEKRVSVDIVPIAEKRVVSIDHQGDYLHIAEKFEMLVSFFYKYPQTTASKDFAVIGIYYDDPTITPITTLRSKACLQLDTDIAKTLLAENDYLTEYVIPAAEYGVFTYKGSYSELGNVYDWLYGKWLGENNREVANDFAYEVYVNNIKTTPPAELITEIYLPLKPITQ